MTDAEFGESEAAVNVCEKNSEMNLLDKVTTAEELGEIPRKLFLYEEIRLSIIQERNQLIAASGILEDISEAKGDLTPNKKPSNSQNKIKGDSVAKSPALRRSLRVETSCSKPSQPGLETETKK